jgi:hypothetical protein
MELQTQVVAGLFQLLVVQGYPTRLSQMVHTWRQQAAVGVAQGQAPMGVPGGPAEFMVGLGEAVAQETAPADSSAAMAALALLAL